MPKAWLAFVTGIGLLLSAEAVAADSALFKGKTITYIVATTPGGGYDTYGRLIRAARSSRGRGRGTRPRGRTGGRGR